MRACRSQRLDLRSHTAGGCLKVARSVCLMACRHSLTAVPDSLYQMCANSLQDGCQHPCLATALDLLRERA